MEDQVHLWFMFCFRHAYVIYKLLVHYFLQSYHIEILVQKHLAGGREGERVLEKKPGTSRKHGWSEQNTPILRLLLKFYFSIVICFSLSLLSTSLKLMNMLQSAWFSSQVFTSLVNQIYDLQQQHLFLIHKLLKLHATVYVYLFGQT